METAMPSRFLIAASTVLLAMPAAAQAPGWQADAVKRAQDYHAANLPELCITPDGSALAPASFELQVGEETAARQALIVEFPCQIGAYSQTAVYLLSDQQGKVSEVVFPSPKFDVTYAGEGESATAEKIVIYETPNLREVVNPSYDPASRTMSERNKWRGLGDAYTETRWGFKHGKFEITHFAVDATFDGKDNPVVLIARDIW
jgi:hypothetical protein